jgi:hypothetical protein
VVLVVLLAIALLGATDVGAAEGYKPDDQTVKTEDDHRDSDGDTVENERPLYVQDHWIFR